MKGKNARVWTCLKTAAADSTQQEEVEGSWTIKPLTPPQTCPALASLPSESQTHRYLPLFRFKQIHGRTHLLEKLCIFSYHPGPYWRHWKTSFITYWIWPELLAGNMFMVWGVNSLRSADFTKRQRVRGFFFSRTGCCWCFDSWAAKLNRLIIVRDKLI